MSASSTKRGYLICSTERTGSSLLSAALHSTGVAGEPYEYFNPVLTHSPWMQGILGGACLLKDGWPKILQYGTTANGVFGAKLHWLHARNLVQLLISDTPLPNDLAAYLAAVSGAGPLPNWLWDTSGVSRAFRFLKFWIPELRLIWVRRRNAVARAISLYRALHTGAWHREPGDPVEVTDELAFDYTKINTLLVVGRKQDAAWSRVFSELNTEPHAVWYEDLARDYSGTVRSALNYLTIDVPSGPLAPPGLERQADMTSLEWEIRYRQAQRTRFAHCFFPSSN